MTERIVALGSLTRAGLSSPWVLVLGGVSRDGNRRARRASRTALRRGVQVVWLDGYEETFDDAPNLRLPLDEATDESLIVVGYRSRERQLPTNRMALEVPDSLKMGPAAAAHDDPPWRAAALEAKRWSRRLLLRARSGPLRRISTALRGYVGWRLIRPQVLSLTSGPSPIAIVYGDDFALTSAWHAARLWPAVPVDMEFNDQ